MDVVLIGVVSALASLSVKGVKTGLEPSTRVTRDGEVVPGGAFAPGEFVEIRARSDGRGAARSAGAD
jgi:hypothetical protein